MLRYADYDIVFQEIPDEVTLAINLSNCPNHCKGCHSAYLMEDVGEPLTEESLSTLLGKYGKAITCVCFMGGDASPAEVEQLAVVPHRKWNNGGYNLSFSPPSFQKDFLIRETLKRSMLYLPFERSFF